jgi:hypothetical protein
MQASMSLSFARFAVMACAMLCGACSGNKPASLGAIPDDEQPRASRKSLVLAERPVYQLLDDPPWVWLDIPEPRVAEGNFEALRNLLDAVAPWIDDWHLHGDDRRLPIDPMSILPLVDRIRSATSLGGEIDVDTIYGPDSTLSVYDVGELTDVLLTGSTHLLETGDIDSALVYADALFVLGWNIGAAPGATYRPAGLARMAFYYQAFGMMEFLDEARGVWEGGEHTPNYRFRGDRHQFYRYSIGRGAVLMNPPNP